MTRVQDDKYMRVVMPKLRHFCKPPDANEVMQEIIWRAEMQQYLSNATERYSNVRSMISLLECLQPSLYDKMIEETEQDEYGYYIVPELDWSDYERYVLG